ncbi:MAG: hypothetical protein OM95_04160 [Bdellovibrio sp. ArHS]|uniref:hypothetical protein n=1 Tax=Bdellovibrio sp. ArHS TaxID=1569284 RepID=UPI0005825B5C|nr:hypothetical protein [Bdellovibrio sp. ArHS]KHD89326.1 MAG: hypothetical protein OM95_04160 [Bdellovibrio sp. ArHS]
MKKFSLKNTLLLPALLLSSFPAFAATTIEGHIGYYEKDRLKQVYDSRLSVSLSNPQEGVYRSEKSENDDPLYFAVTIDLQGLPSDFSQFSSQEVDIHQARLFSTINSHAQNGGALYSVIELESSQDGINCKFTFGTPSSISAFVLAPDLKGFACYKKNFFNGYFGGAREKFRVEFRTP